MLLENALGTSQQVVLGTWAVHHLCFSGFLSLSVIITLVELFNCFISTHKFCFQFPYLQQVEGAGSEPEALVAS